MATKAKLTIVKTDSESFNLDLCANKIADSAVILAGASQARNVLNQGLKDAIVAKMTWGRVGKDGTMAPAIHAALIARGVKEQSATQMLTAIKFAFENGIELTDMDSKRFKDSVKANGGIDLFTGKVKKVKGAKPSSKAGKTKTEATVQHCGYGLLKALEQDGFIKWLNHFIDSLEIRGVDSTDIDELKLDLVRDTLVECNYASVNDKGDMVVTIIKVSDNEADSE
jgi:hypothetical protein